MAPHISISAEPVFYIGQIAITNSILTSWIVSAILIITALWAKNNIKNTKRPKGFQNFLELVIESLSNLTDSITESPIKSKYIFPFILSFFLFIVLNNLIGLFPGAGTIGRYVESPEETHASIAPTTSPFIKPALAANVQSESNVTTDNTQTTSPTITDSESAKTETKETHKKFVPFFRAGTADMNTTLALALVSCISTWVLGVKFLKLHYFDRFKNPLELISEFSRLISFTFRLFGNVFAGEVLISVMTSLVPIIIPSVFIGMEIFVSFIQAYVFAILTLIFMTLATTSHGPDEAHAHT